MRVHTIMEQTCTKCGATKPQFDFYQRPNSRGWCKMCHRAQARAWALSHPERATANSRRKRQRNWDRNAVTVTHKICGRCKLSKAADDFPIGRSKHDGLHDACKACSAQYAAGQRAANLGHTVWTYSRCHDKKRQLHTAPVEVFDAMIALPCEYCALTPARGVDRVDNARGHEADNMLPCCKICNQTRMDNISVAAMKQFLGPAIRAAREAGAL